MTEDYKKTVNSLKPCIKIKGVILSEDHGETWFLYRQDYVTHACSEYGKFNFAKGVNLEGLPLKTDFDVLKNWRKFERQVAEFFGVKNYKVRRNVNQIGKSRVSYEIDVLATNQNESIACQCKSMRKHVSKNIIMYWEGVCKDLPYEVRPAIASQSGFTGPAIIYAQTHNIMLISQLESRLELMNAT
jgi:hypothetical protein